jgi:general L-amino acid transport system substrate-binding protein
MRMLKPLLAAAAALAFVAVGAADAETLKTVQDRGKLVCGVSQGIAGFSIKDDKGEWTGFDVDFCRALAAAIFNDPGKVEYVPLSAAERFGALKDKKIDVLSRNSTWTMGREEDANLLFAGVTYYDGQAFMTPKASKATSALELDGAKVCVQKGTTSEPNAKDFFDSNHVNFEIVEADTVSDLVANYLGGKCNVMTTDESALFALRSQFPKPGEHAILPDVISKEPLGPVVRQDDMQWFNIVKWVNYALLDAEEMGVSSKTIDEALQSQKPEVRRLVGTQGDFGKPLGLTNAWAANAIRTVGNYGEIFDRNVGVHTSLAIPRGLNELWNNGGIQYAPPIR